ncbi:type VI secretion system baseplate subunit TssE [Paraburkholderia sp. MMS20-SJTN17]|uniref:Type VI secretion system baseplate subunit TssE n=1 Tax=Paraburkholderia translucens TaxID=2886945 RepID=A0ABS8KBW7_9BURK|nr:type VI secretion system baseplate subunit TssE [Paraburkholderia sp. MMS20-SJTN17]MCC8402258.1 type VI secretion system baseplate subunit TssE [Paraburkholderia sp. MMS20-SJTN17]
MPTGPSLYDMLLGHIDGEPLDGHDDRTLEILSVLANIRRILNTRCGAVKHVPDYGLPDLTDVYRNLPASVHDLRNQMETTLRKFEPRLRSVEIEIDDKPDPGLLVSFTMVCRLKKAGLVRFGTYFDPPGRMRVERLVNPDRDR